MGGFYGIIIEMNDETIVIVGPTASGKTGVAIEIAQEVATLSRAIAASETATAPSLGFKPRSVRCSSLPGTSSELASPPDLSSTSSELATQQTFAGAEIISADSRAIYRGMEVGTAAPSLEEQAGIPHWGVGIVEPGERFTVADWKNYAEEKIAEIRARGKLPIVAGGTGLYVDALVYNYDFTEHKKLSQEDRKKTAEEICANYLIVGIKWSPEELRQRITLRADKMFNQELYDETRKLVGKYNWNTQAMKSNIYQFAWSYLQGEISLERAKELFIYDDWHLAKRQMTWFKRNKNIVWLPLAEVEPYVIKCIQDEQRR